MNKKYHRGVFVCILLHGSALSHDLCDATIKHHTAAIMQLHQNPTTREQTATAPQAIAAARRFIHQQEAHASTATIAGLLATLTLHDYAMRKEQSCLARGLAHKTPAAQRVAQWLNAAHL